MIESQYAEFCQAVTEARQNLNSAMALLQFKKFDLRSLKKAIRRSAYQLKKADIILNVKPEEWSASHD